MTDDEILALAEQHGKARGEHVRMWDFARGELLHFARAIQQHEREACARECDKRAVKHCTCSESAMLVGPLAGNVLACMIEAQGCAAAIRSRT